MRSTSSTVDQAGLATIEDLLAGIKNVLTMPGVHFLIVAGPDLHDRAIRDAARGNGVYESVFGWRMYVPCVWDAPDRLIADIIHADVPAERLARSGRWSSTCDSRPGGCRVACSRRSIALSPGRRTLPGCGSAPRTSTGLSSTRAWSVFCDGSFHGQPAKPGCSPSPSTKTAGGSAGITSSTRCCRATASLFGAADLFREGEEAKFDPLLRISRRNVDNLLDHLAEHEVLTKVEPEMDGRATLSAASPSPGPRCSSSPLRSASCSTASRAARGAAGRPQRFPGPGDAWPASTVPESGASHPPRFIGDRYELARCCAGRYYLLLQGPHPWSPASRCRRSCSGLTLSNDPVAQTVSSGTRISSGACRIRASSGSKEYFAVVPSGSPP